MRQVKRYPNDKEYDFGVGITDQFGLLKKAGDFISEEDIKKYEVGEKFLEPIGTERKDWSDEIPENTEIVMFNIEVGVSGGDKEERGRMVNQFEVEFKDYIKQRGEAILKVINIQIVKKKKKKSKRK